MEFQYYISFKSVYGSNTMQRCDSSHILSFSTVDGEKNITLVTGFRQLNMKWKAFILLTETTRKLQ